ncbi:MAG: hypothetical protein MH472_01375 [Bacteroidia bacterium]|nr:hypothetical protein [Bacteroidia bacterium]
MKKLIPYLFVFFIVGIFTQSCRKNDLFTKDAVSLQFSTDTVFFDTIFSKLGNNPNSPRSITLQVRVTNPASNAVKTNISLLGNFYGIFKLNVDGRAGNVFQDIEIRGNDSIYIFVQAYIDPVGSNTPFIITDQILFETNGNKQDVDLVAWTQDADYYQNEVLDCNTGNLLWTNNRPIVIYDSILIPKGCTLTVEAGTQIHNYNLSCILVQGTLIVNGTTDKPVVFQGSRLDDEYKEFPGQWIGLRFLPGSSGNVIEGAIIKNAYIGIEVDSMPQTGTYGLVLKSSIIRNMSACGLLNYSSKVYAENNLVANTGLYTFIGELGGTYNLVHNTFTSQSQISGRKDPGFYLSNAPGRAANGSILYSFPLVINLQNNIIHGSLDDEFYINDDPGGIPISNPVIENCLLKTKNNSFNTNGNILNRDPRFLNVSKQDYDLDASSPCRNAGKNIGILFDLKNRNRNVSAPSIGAYEAQ